MKNLLVFSITIIFFLIGNPWIQPTVLAQGNRAPIQLEAVKTHQKNKEAVIRGGKLFSRYCAACHRLKYLQFNPIAKTIGIPDSPVHSIQGVTPPDLSLSAKFRGADWIYTYLISFYHDSKQASGSNNLLVKNTSMANPFIGLQGEQRLTTPLSTLLTSKPQRVFSVLKQVKPGQLSPEVFDQMMNDIVTFLVYVSDPSQVQREKIGFWVLLFLFLFVIVAYFLKKIYWQDIK